MDINVTPEEMFGLGAAVAVIPVIVAHLKPALRRWWPEDGPWELLADLVGVLWVLGLWQAGYAPASVNNPWAAAITGLAIGIMSSRARDAAQAVAAPRAFVSEPEPWEGIAPDPVPRPVVRSLSVDFDASALPAEPPESRSAIKAY